MKIIARNSFLWFCQKGVRAAKQRQYLFMDRHEVESDELKKLFIP
jgi:hypothetical protein